ncbi:hypothetical protein F511_32244 [Dorcoceras hygrometricum]|uniref:Uncharacterized protein n=1 Tax=Dorcoceras hygrometricum TaxID=472368 RepID=A0A2Z7AFQ3_9LAMI|nr:hypothetical protein F511_32244 [Dorcoceras hygrometricum]
MIPVVFQQYVLSLGEVKPKAFLCEGLRAIQLLIQQEDFALLFQQTKLQWIQSQRKDIQTQEDSGEALDEPVARFVVFSRLGSQAQRIEGSAEAYSGRRIYQQRSS